MFLMPDEFCKKGNIFVPRSRSFGAIRQQNLDAG